MVSLFIHTFTCKIRVIVINRIMNKQVTIRLIQKEDLERIRGWINKPEVRDNLVILEEISDEDQKSWYEAYENDDSKKVFAIEYKGEHLGNISLFKIDKSHGRAQVSIFIGEKEYRNKNLGTSVLQMLFDLAFRKLLLSKISLEVLVDNKQAIACYTKAGMQQEGILRSHVCIRGKRRDMMVMAILAEEYFQR